MEGLLRSGMESSSDHGARRCSRRDSGKAFEKASVLISVVLCNSVGNECGGSVGVGMTSRVDEMSCNVTSAGFADTSTKTGHSSNVLRWSISSRSGSIQRRGGLAPL
jgi:hypothetical protein